GRAREARRRRRRGDRQAQAHRRREEDVPRVGRRSPRGRRRPEEKLIETVDNRFAERPYRVELAHPEFTSICPLTGAPDFGTVTIRYVPAAKLAELKSLRDYLTGFRDRKIFQEEVVNEVLDEFVRSVEPQFAEVEGVFNMRGGMTTRAVAR